MRNSFSFKEAEEAVVLKVTTYCPEKWLLLDQETGQIFRGNEGGYWDRLETKTKDNK